ncbi:hypothetical protein [Streptomyces tendae]|uniref:hypothetical protein n=1 Tax=Streptomyces tendae TaxID=1932 RepID=UPI003D754364
MRTQPDQEPDNDLDPSTASTNRMDEILARRLMAAERRGRRSREEDLRAAIDRVKAVPGLAEAYGIADDATDTSDGGAARVNERARELLERVHAHLETMSLVSNVTLPVDRDGGNLLSAMTAGSGVALGQVLGTAMGRDSTAASAGQVLEAALVSRRQENAPARLGNAVIHWKPEVRRRTLHTPAPDGTTATSDDRAATLSSLYPLLAHTHNDAALRLALAEADTFATDNALYNHLAEGHPATEEYFGAHILGDLRWNDVNRIDLKYSNAVEKASALDVQAQLQDFATLHGVPVDISLTWTPPIQSVDSLPDVHVNDIGTNAKQLSDEEQYYAGLWESVTGGRSGLVRDYTPFYARQIDGFSNLNTRNIEFVVHGNIPSINRIPSLWARWEAPGVTPPRLFFVRAGGDHRHVEVQFGDGTIVRMNPDEFADFMAYDPDLLEQPYDVDIVLLIPSSGAQGLDLPRAVARSTGRRVWAPSGDIDVLHDPATGEKIITVFASSHNTGAFTAYILVHPGDVPDQNPSPGWIDTVDAGLVPDGAILTQTIVYAGLPVGRFSLSDRDHGRWQYRQNRFAAVTEYFENKADSDPLERIAETRRDIPWKPLIENQTFPYFFQAHGSRTLVSLETHEESVSLTGTELGRYLKRRPSVAALPEQTPIVLTSCATGDGTPDTPGLVAQLVADETNHVVYAPTDLADNDLNIRARPGERMEWRRFEPRQEPLSALDRFLNRTAGIRLHNWHSLEEVVRTVRDEHTDNTPTTEHNPIQDSDIEEIVTERAAADLPTRSPLELSEQECLTLLHSLRDRLFPGGTASGQTVDDSVLDTRPQENRLVPGPAWTTIHSWDQITAALQATGPGTTALILNRRITGKGHAFAAYALPNTDTDTDTKAKTTVAWIELQSTHPHTGITTHPPHQAPLETRAIIIDPTGQALPHALTTPPTSTAHALTDPAPHHQYGAIGFEVEDRRPLYIGNGEVPPYATVLARHPSGAKLVTDQYTLWRQRDGSLSMRPDAGVPMTTPVLEFVSPPLAALPMESGPERPSLESGLALFESTWKRLDATEQVRRPGEPAGPSQAKLLKDLLGTSQEWHFTPAGWTHPSTEWKLTFEGWRTKVGTQPADYVQPPPQYTVGVPSSALARILELAFDAHHIRGSASLFYIGRSFSNTIAHFYAMESGISDIGTEHLPFLSDRLDVEEVRGYTWLLFLHVVAGPLRARFDPDTLIKGFIPVASRNAFGPIQQGLHPSVREFLARRELWITEQFERALSVLFLIFPAALDVSRNTHGVLDRLMFSGRMTHRQWLSTAITGKTFQGREVKQLETVGMLDFPQDQPSRHFGAPPLILLELREFRAVEGLRNVAKDLVLQTSHLYRRATDNVNSRLSRQQLSTVFNNPLAIAISRALRSADEILVDGKPIALSASEAGHQIVSLALRGEAPTAAVENWLWDMHKKLTNPPLAGAYPETQELLYRAGVMAAVTRVLAEHGVTTTPTQEEIETAFRRFWDTQPSPADMAAVIWVQRSVRPEKLQGLSGNYILDAIRRLSAPNSPVLFNGKRPLPEDLRHHIPSTAQQFTAFLEGSHTSSVAGAWTGNGSWVPTAPATLPPPDSARHHVPGSSRRHNRPGSYHNHPMRGGSRDTGTDPVAEGRPLRYPLTIDKAPRIEGAGPLRVAPPAPVSDGENRTGAASWWTAHGDYPSTSRGYAYDINTAGDIRLPDGTLLKADRWLAHGNDFIHQPTGHLMRGDTGWIGHIANYDVLRRTFDKTEYKAHTVRLGNRDETSAQAGPHSPGLYFMPLSPAHAQAARTGEHVETHALHVPGLTLEPIGSSQTDHGESRGGAQSPASRADRPLDRWVDLTARVNSRLHKAGHSKVSTQDLQSIARSLADEGVSLKQNVVALSERLAAEVLGRPAAGLSPGGMPPRRRAKFQLGSDSSASSSESEPDPVQATRSWGITSQLDRWSVDHPPLAGSTPGRRPLRLGDLLPHERDWWRLYIAPADHATASKDHPHDPGRYYDRDTSPGFRKGMLDAYRSVLDNRAPHPLTWESYKSLYERIMAATTGRRGLSGRPGADGRPRETVYSSGARVLAPDVLSENIGGRPLLASEQEYRNLADFRTDRPVPLMSMKLEDGAVVVTTHYSSRDIPSLVSGVFRDYSADIDAARTDHQRLRAIARVVRNLHMLHLFSDGNGRLNVYVLLPHLLMSNGFHPVVPVSTGVAGSVARNMSTLFNGGYSLDQIATALRAVQPVLPPAMRVTLPNGVQQLPAAQVEDVTRLAEMAADSAITLNRQARAQVTVSITAHHEHSATGAASDTVTTGQTTSVARVFGDAVARRLGQYAPSMRSQPRITTAHGPSGPAHGGGLDVDIAFTMRPGPGSDQASAAELLPYEVHRAETLLVGPEAEGFLEQAATIVSGYITLPPVLGRPGPERARQEGQRLDVIRVVAAGLLTHGDAHAHELSLYWATALKYPRPRSAPGLTGGSSRSHPGSLPPSTAQSAGPSFWDGHDRNRDTDVGGNGRRRERERSGTHLPGDRADAPQHTTGGQPSSHHRADTTDIVAAVLQRNGRRLREVPRKPGETVADAVRRSLGAVRATYLPAESRVPTAGVDVTLDELERARVAPHPAQLAEMNLRGGRIPLADLNLSPAQQFTVLLESSDYWAAALGDAPDSNHAPQTPGSSRRASSDQHDEDVAKVLVMNMNRAKVRRIFESSVADLRHRIETHDASVLSGAPSPSDRTGRASGGETLEQLKEHMRRTEEDLGVYEALAVAGDVWHRVDESLVRRIVAAERRAQRDRKHDKSEALGRIRKRSVAQDSRPDEDAGRSDQLLERVHAHLAGAMSLVSHVKLDGPGGSAAVLDALTGGPGVPIGTQLATVAGRRVAPRPELGLLAAALISEYQENTPAEQGEAVIHWKQEVRVRTLHPFTPRTGHQAGGSGAATTLSSLFPLLTHGDSGAVRLALAEGGGALGRGEQGGKMDAGRWSTNAQFNAVIYGDLRWDDVDRVVLKHWDARSRSRALLAERRLGDFAGRHGLGFEVTLAQVPAGREAKAGGDAAIPSHAAPSRSLPEPSRSERPLPEPPRRNRPLPEPPRPDQAPIPPTSAREPSRPVPIRKAFSASSHDGSSAFGNDYRPMADREDDDLSGLVHDEVAHVTDDPQDPDPMTQRAPWSTWSTESPFFVRVNGTPFGVTVQLSDGTVTWVNAQAFADLLAGDTDLRRQPEHAPVVLLMARGGAGGLDLPRRVAQRTGRTVWSASARLDVRYDETGRKLVTRFRSHKGTEPEGNWIMSRPDDLPERDPGTVGGQSPRDEIRTLDGETVEDWLVVTHTIIGPDHRSLGRSSHSLADQAYREPVHRGLHSRGAFMSKLSKTTWSQSDVPWRNDNSPDRMPYFFNSHGNSKILALRAADPNQPRTPPRSVQVSGKEVGRFLRRRPSLSRLDPDVPVVLLSCDTGVSPGDGSEPVAQHIADEIGRVVFAPTGVANVFLQVASKVKGQPAEWRRFEPRGRSHSGESGDRRALGAVAGRGATLSRSAERAEPVGDAVFAALTRSPVPDAADQEAELLHGLVSLELRRHVGWRGQIPDRAAILRHRDELTAVERRQPLAQQAVAIASLVMTGNRPHMRGGVRKKTGRPKDTTGQGTSTAGDPPGAEGSEAPRESRNALVALTPKEKRDLDLAVREIATSGDYLLVHKVRGAAEAAVVAAKTDSVARDGTGTTASGGYRWEEDFSARDLITAMLDTPRLMTNHELLVRLVREPGVLKAAANFRQVGEAVASHESLVQELAGSPLLLDELTERGIPGEVSQEGMYELLGRPEFIAELEASAPARKFFYEHPQLIINTKGNIPVFKKLVEDPGSLMDVLENSLEYSEELMKVDRPDVAIDGLLYENGLVLTMLHLLFKGSGSTTVFRRLLSEASLRKRLGKYPEQSIAILANPALLQSFAVDDSPVPELLRRSPLLIDVLEDKPAIVERLANNVEALEAAVENPEVALMLSDRPTAFDHVPDDGLVSELRTALRATGTQLPPMAEGSGGKLEELRRGGHGWRVVLDEDNRQAAGMLAADEALLDRILASPDILQYETHVIRRLFDPKKAMAREGLRAGRLGARSLRVALRHDHYRAHEYSESFIHMIESDREGAEAAYNLHHVYCLHRYMDGVHWGRFWADPVAREAIKADWTSSYVIGVISAQNILDQLPGSWGTLLGDRAILLKLGIQIGAAPALVEEGFMAGLEERLRHAPGLLGQLERASVDMPVGHWIRLLKDDDMMGTLNTYLHTATAQGLLADSHTLKEAIARPDFWRTWVADEESRARFDNIALAPRRKNHKVAPLVTAIRETGVPELSSMGFPVRTDLYEAVRILVSDISKENLRQKLMDQTISFMGEVPGVDELVKRRDAVRKQPALEKRMRSDHAVAQGVFFKPGVYEVLTARPSLLDHLPVLGGLILEDDHLARHLIHDNAAFTAFSQNVGWMWVQLAPNNSSSRALRTNPAFPAGTLALMDALTAYPRSLHALMENSEHVARALGDRKVLDVLAEEPSVVEALSTAVPVAVAAAVGSQLRLEALAAEPGLLAALEQRPKVAEALAARPHVAADRTRFTKLVTHAELHVVLEEHPDRMADVLSSDAALDVALATPGWVKTLDKVAPPRRRRLMTPDYLNLVRRHPDLVADLSEDTPLGAAVLAVPQLPKAIMENGDLLTQLRRQPILVESLRLRPYLLEEAKDPNSRLWPVLERHPGLAKLLSAGLRRRLQDNANVVDALLAPGLSYTAEELGVLAQSLRRGPLLSLLDERADFATAFLARPQWQARTVQDASFASGLRDLLRRDEQRFDSLVSSVDPQVLLDAVTVPAPASARPDATPRAAGRRDAPSQRQPEPSADHDRGRDAGVRAPTVQQNDQRSLPDKAPEVVDLLAGPLGADFAKILRGSPEILRVLDAMPWRTDGLQSAEHLRGYAFRPFLERELPRRAPAASRKPDADFNHLLSDYLAEIDAAPDDAHRRRIKEAALYTWEDVVSERADAARAERETQRSRRETFRPEDPATWEHSGRIRFAGGLKRNDFLDERYRVLELLARGDDGPREDRVAVNSKLHQHLDGGAGGVSFFYALARDGRVDVVAYAISNKRQKDAYRWQGGTYSDGPFPLEGIADDPLLKESRELVTAAGPGAHDPGESEPARPHPKPPVSARNRGADEAHRLSDALAAFHTACSQFTGQRPSQSAAEALLTAAQTLRALGVDVFSRVADTMSEAESRRAKSLLTPARPTSSTTSSGPVADDWVLGAIGYALTNLGRQQADILTRVILRAGPESVASTRDPANTQGEPGKKPKRSGTDRRRR